jgi:hypothetical protein
MRAEPPPWYSAKFSAASEQACATRSFGFATPRQEAVVLPRRSE